MDVEPDPVASDRVTTRRLKRRLRREIRARILALDPEARRAEEAALLDRFESLPGSGRAGTVLLYAAAFPEEFATRPLIDRARDGGRIVLCPRVDAEAACLRLCRIDDPAHDFIAGRLGIPEPAPHCPEVAPGAVDWVLVPGLAFDRRGYRLGRGGGYYDRLLAVLDPLVPRWSLAFREQLVEALPVEPHDAPVDGVAGAGWLVRRPGQTARFYGRSD